MSSVYSSSELFCGKPPPTEKSRGKPAGEARREVFFFCGRLIIDGNAARVAGCPGKASHDLDAALRRRPWICRLACKGAAMCSNCRAKARGGSPQRIEVNYSLEPWGAGK